MRDQVPTAQYMVNRRLPFVLIIMAVMAGVLLFQLVSFQWFSPEIRNEFALRGQANYQSARRLPAQRGVIYDRDGEPLAFNAIEYEIGASPNLIVDPSQVAAQLAVALNQDELEIYRKVSSDSQWVQLDRHVPAHIGQAVADLDIFGVIIDPIPSRFYPQRELAAQVVGFTFEDEDSLTGVMGVEGKYNSQLAGRVVNQQVSTIPFDLPDDTAEEITQGMDVVLTIDRDIQFVIEDALKRAVEDWEAEHGVVIVMNPRNGDVLAMANYPSFDPNAFGEVEDEKDLLNLAIAQEYDAGPVVLPLTVAGAIEQHVIPTDWTYDDRGIINIGGLDIYNPDGRAYGVVDLHQVVVDSLDVGAATIALEMGYERFYEAMRTFGFGTASGVDLIGEIAGELRTPLDEDWSEQDLGRNSYGDFLPVTPIQLITAYGAIANDGLMMQPRVVKQIVDGDNVIEAQTISRGRPLSEENAHLLRDMLVDTVEENVPEALVPGYQVAGKAGTAEIPIPLGEGTNASIVTFIGFLPADDPQFIMLVKLERPNSFYASDVAAPLFSEIAQQVAIYLGIPPDNIRHDLASSQAVDPSTQE